jgi:PAS domain S-box-containing protein
METILVEGPDLEDYKKFFDETPVALVRTNLKTGEFLMANKFAAHLFGFDTVEELMSSAKITDFYPLEERKKLIREIKRRGVVEGYEICFRLHGKEVWASCRLRINCGNSCVEGSLIDITDQVEMRNMCLGNLKEVGKKLDNKIAALAGL